MRTAMETRGALPQHVFWIEMLMRAGVLSAEEGLRAEAEGPRLTVPLQAQMDARSLLGERGIEGPFVALAPWNAQAHFRWPEERWVEAAASVDLKNVVILGGRDKNEVAHAARMVEALRARGVNATSFAGLWGLDRDAALFERASLVLAVDSGPAHVARAVGARTSSCSDPAPRRSGRRPEPWAFSGPRAATAAVSRAASCLAASVSRTSTSRGS
jgi:ADP-heptose:LPS heptosyltransferase